MRAGTQILTQTVSAIDWSITDPMEDGPREKLPLTSCHRKIVAMVNFCLCETEVLFDFVDADCTWNIFTNDLIYKQKRNLPLFEFILDSFVTIKQNSYVL